MWSQKNVSKKIKLPFTEPQAKSGYIQGYIFENNSIGLKGQLFFSILFDFFSIEYDDETWPCSFCMEWIPFKGRSWREIENLDFQNKEILENLQTRFIYLVITITVRI